jgi:glycosyltransferase involved in cell wall biosynthesis
VDRPLRIFFGLTGQLWYGGLTQQSVMLVKYLREFGCEVLPFVGVAPPLNDEVALNELGYVFSAFNVADYMFEEQPLPLRWALRRIAAHRIASTDPRELRCSAGVPAAASLAPQVDAKAVFERIVFHPRPEDIARINRVRRQFRPDIEYGCELSMIGLFGHIEDLGVPLVSAAQGYEIAQRMGIDLVSLIRTYAGRLDAVISGSYANVRENIARDLPELVPRTRVIHYGIVADETYEMPDEEARRRTERYCPLGDGEFVIMWLSRIDVEKGADLALHALRILRDEGVPARLRIAGDSLLGSHYRATIEAKIAMMDLGDYVDLIGLVPTKEDKVALLRTSDAFLATFLKSEPFGLVICEAMAAGLPVVAPDLGAPPEILLWSQERYGDPAGLLYRPHDTGHMATQLRLLWSHPERARAMGAAGRRAVKEHFNARRMTRDVLHLFQELVERNRRARTAPVALASQS